MNLPTLVTGEVVMLKLLLPGLCNGVLREIWSVQMQSNMVDNFNKHPESPEVPRILEISKEYHQKQPWIELNPNFRTKTEKNVSAIFNFREILSHVNIGMRALRSFKNGENDIVTGPAAGKCFRNQLKSIKNTLKK